MSFAGWEAVMAKRANSPYTVTDFETAAYALMAQQVLYASDRLQRVAYNLVSEHLEAYRQLFAAFGIHVHADRVYEYVAALPKTQRKTAISAEMTLLVLTLRHLYHESAARGDIDAGRVAATIEDLQADHKKLTGRDLTGSLGELKGLLEQAKRMGMVRLVPVEDSDQPFEIEIMPAIVELVDENHMSRLAAQYSALASGASADPVDVGEQTATGASEDEGES